MTGPYGKPTAAYQFQTKRTVSSGWSVFSCQTNWRALQAGRQAGVRVHPMGAPSNARLLIRLLIRQPVHLRTNEFDCGSVALLNE
jgi:hypothetical protein